MSPEPEIGQRAPAGTPVPPRALDAAPAPPAVQAPRIVEVTVDAVHPKEVEVRLADGRIGVIQRSEIQGRVEPGDTLEAALLSRDDPKGRVPMSRAWAVTHRAWERVMSAAASRELLTGPVTKTVKGGAVVDLGLRGFLPVSLLGEGVTDPSSLVGHEVEVVVIEADREAGKVVVSVRDAQRRRRRAEERELLRSLEPGSTVTGTVVSTADHGAVVDLGGARGLVHRSELTWGRLGEVSDVVTVGDVVQVVVLDVNRSKRRISLSLRATSPDPYEGVEPGSVHASVVTRVVEYGAFVRLESGAEGLVHVSELSELPDHRADQLVTPGEEVTVKVLDVDRTRRRLSLSVRQALLG